MFSGLKAPTLFSRFGSNASITTQQQQQGPPVPEDGKPPSGLATSASRINTSISTIASPSPLRRGSGLDSPTQMQSHASLHGLPPPSPTRQLRQGSIGGPPPGSPSRSSSERNIQAAFTNSATPSRRNSNATAMGSSISSSGVAPADACHVTVRMRPLTYVEESSGNPAVWEIDDRVNRVALSFDFAERNRKPATEYFFDAVQVGSDNKDLYEDSAKSVVRASMEGINGTVFAYGQTASGKTYSMMGVDEQPGVIPQAVDDIFGYIREQSGDREYLLRVSYMEIYNETIRDLLSPDQIDLRIHEDRKRGVFVSPLKEEIVTSPKQVMRIIRKGEENRHFGATDYNEHSSRSHTIFQMIIESRERGQSGAASPRVGGPGSARGRGTVMISQLNLIDLAGSEKATTDMDRRKEGAFINKSLLTLGTVISKLTDGKPTAGNHIPYRDSKLTRILQSSLSGNARISVICTISPAGPNAEETQNTLKFASRVKKVTVNAQANRIVDEKALLQKYKQEIDELRQELMNTNELLERERRQQPQSAGSGAGAIDSERKKFEEQLEEGQIARTALKERIDHLTNLILTSKTITPKHLLDWSAPADPASNRNSVMMEDGLLPTSPNISLKRPPNPPSKSQFDNTSKEFLKRHIQEIDTRDERIRNLELLVMQLKSSRDPDVLNTIEGYERTSGTSIKSMRTVVAELDSARRQKGELEVVCAEMEDQLRELEVALRDAQMQLQQQPRGGRASSQGMARDDVEDLVDENRALKSTVAGLRIEMDQRLASNGGNPGSPSSSSSPSTTTATIAAQRAEIESLTNEVTQNVKTITALRDSIRMLELSNDMFVQSASRAHSPPPGEAGSPADSAAALAAHGDLELALERERKLRNEEGRSSVERIASLEADLAVARAELGVFSLVGGFGAMNTSGG